MKFFLSVFAACAFVAQASDDEHNSERKLASYVGNCMQYNWREEGGNNQDLVCRAKEVYLESLRAVTDGTCAQGGEIEVTLIGDVHFNAERWDPGWYVATDGGDALEGQCALVSLSKGTDYTTTGNGEVIWDKDEGTLENSAGDLCGDVLISGGKGTTLSQTEIISSTTISCNDQDYDDKLDVSICFSWRVKGKDAPCKPKALYPGTTAKCFCETYTVENISVDHFSFDDAMFDEYIWDLDAPETFSEDYIEGEIRSGEKNCLNDANWEDYVSDIECSADEVSLTDVLAFPPGTCNLGDNVTVSVYGEIHFASARYDPAWYIAADGGDALTGNCFAHTLDPNANYYFDNGGSIVGSGDCADISSPNGPTTFKDAEIINSKQILCDDQDGDGFLDFSICFGWSLSEDSAYCDPEFPQLGGHSQCDCERINLEDIAVISPVQADVVPACS